MSHFSYKDGVLHAESTPLSRIAQQFGTPTYVYSKAALLQNFDSYADACAGRDALVCYAMKANSNLAILDLLARRGAGFDIVSGGELLRVIAAGGDPAKVIFSGVGKTVDEMRLALSHDILCFNVESIAELHRLNGVAGESGKTARVSLRVNPNVDAKTHPYIATGLKANKFGVAFADALATYRTAAALPHLEVTGIDCHIGSQLLDDAPLLEALDKLIDLIATLALAGIVLHHLDIGGGLGINYGEAGEAAPVPVADYLGRLFRRIDAWRAEQYEGTPSNVNFEPGRSNVGDIGVLLTSIEFLPGEERTSASSMPR
jgi:diaminopimelate decarboxylase